MKIVPCFLFEFIWLHLPAISSCHAMSTHFKSVLTADVFPLWRWAGNWVIAPLFFFFFLTNGTDQIPLASLSVEHFPSPWIIFVVFFFCTASLLPNSFPKGEPLHCTQHLVGNKFLHGGKTTISVPTHYLDLRLQWLHFSFSLHGAGDCSLSLSV